MSDELAKPKKSLLLERVNGQASGTLPNDFEIEIPDSEVLAMTEEEAVQSSAELKEIADSLEARGYTAHRYRKGASDFVRFFKA